MSAPVPTFKRETFAFSRALEFFSSERELTAQIGFSPALWPLAILKELIDNALDACESANTPPAIIVELHPDALIVQDNGPGLPLTIIERSLDYDFRVSDKTGYISPSRGQQGNALKTLWAAPFVATGQSRVVIETAGDRWEINVHLNRIAQQPEINLERAGNSDVKTGTKIILHWDGIAGSLAHPSNLSFYMLLMRFHNLNPHLALTVRNHGHRDEETVWNAKAPDWKRWSPNEPTAPHWYQSDHLRNLIALKIGNEQHNGDARTINQFIREFRGLTSTGKARDVAAKAGLQNASLQDLVENGDVDMSRVQALLTAMQAAARPVNPTLLGVIGETHCIDALAGYEAEGIQYRSAKETHEGLPYILEIAFGILPSHKSRVLVIGVNFTYAIQQPFTDLTRALSEAQVQAYDPVVLLLHLTTPLINFTDRGKTRIELPAAITDKMSALVKAVTKSFTAAKRRADRDDRMKATDAEELRKANEPKNLTTKEAAWQLMEQAYLKASSNKKLPANARQVMYAARRGIIELTGKARPWSKDSYFTQKLLPDFIDAHPELCADWDVVYDVRGHLREPHTGKMVELGTLAVRGYINGWRSKITASANFAGLGTEITTSGPKNRYQFALFLEKEGFDALLRKSRLAERFDIAIFSTKGMSVTAARKLVESLSEAGVTILVVRDFDLYGFRIAHTIQNNTRRYQFKTPPKVIDLGLRLQDAQAMGLDSEETEYDGDPVPDLKRYGATDKEIEFLTQKRKVGIFDEDGNPVFNEYGEPDYKTVPPSRIELNEMDSETFITWLEEKLKEQKVKKVIPDRRTMAAAWQCQWQTAQLNRMIRKAQAKIGDAPKLPPTITRQLEKALEKNTEASWDEILANRAANARRYQHRIVRTIRKPIKNRYIQKKKLRDATQ